MFVLVFCDISHSVMCTYMQLDYLFTRILFCGLQRMAYLFLDLFLLKFNNRQEHIDESDSDQVDSNQMTQNKVHIHVRMSFTVHCNLYKAKQSWFLESYFCPQATQQPTPLHYLVCVQLPCTLLNVVTIKCCDVYIMNNK